MQTIPFYKPDVTELDAAALEEALAGRSESLVETLEADFAKEVGIRHAVATCNATSALHLSLMALDLKRGDKIICSVNAHPSVPEVIRHFDAEPIFVDINPDDFTIDLEQMEGILAANRSKKLRGAIINFMAGRTPDLTRLYEMARKFKIFLIEDATHALGGVHEGKKIGSLSADITVFSFAPMEGGAAGNGGMLVTDNDDLQERAVMLRHHGIVTPANAGVEYLHDVMDIGMDYTMSGVDAAFAVARLAKQGEVLARRKAIAAIYDKKLTGVPHITPPPAGGDNTYYAYIIKVDKNRDGFAKELAAKGIQVGLHYIPLHTMNYYRHKYGLKVNSFPKALNNYHQILSLPIYSRLTDDEANKVADAVAQIANARTW